MDAPAARTGEIHTGSFMSSKSNLKKRERLEPRSSGFVLRSSKCKATDFCEFADAHRFHAIRTFLSEDHKNLSGGKLKQSRRKLFAGSSKHLKRMLQSQSRSEESSKLPVAYRKTSKGWNYGQIYDVDNNISTYNVNNFKRSTPSTRSRKSKLSDGTIPKETESEELPRQKAQQVKDSAPEGSALHSKGQDRLANHLINEAVSSQGGHNRRLASKLVSKRVATPKDHGSSTPKPFIETPAIPLSPMKVSLEYDIEPSQDWVEQQSIRRQFTRRSPPQTPTQELQVPPIARDFAKEEAFALLDLRIARSRSCAPAGKPEEQHTVAGRSHNYHGFPSFRQRIEELQASDTRNASQAPEKAQAPASREVPKPPPSSTIALTPEPIIGLKPSHFIDINSKSPSIISAESTAEDIQSDTSSGIVSNAQSAIMMRGQIAAGQYNNIVSMRKPPPMPGPAPTRALPSLPEGHDSVIAPATPRASESLEQRRGNDGNTSQSSPKKHEHTFYLSHCNSPAVAKRSNSLVNNNAMMMVPMQAQSPPSSPIPIQRQDMSVMLPPLEQHVPKTLTSSTRDTRQRQRKRNETTSARKARDFARVASRKAIVDDGDPLMSEARSGGAEQRLKDVGTLPSASVTNVDVPSHVQGLRNQAHTYRTDHPNRDSFKIHRQEDGSATFSQNQKLSPIIVIAEQEPTIPLPPCRMNSQKSQLSIATSTDNHVPNQSPHQHQHRYQTDGFHHICPCSSQRSTSQSSLHLPPDQLELKPTRPLSAPSMQMSQPPTTRPAVASRVPTPFTNPLLRAQSNSSSHRLSSTSAAHNSFQIINDLEARLAAIENKNVMLERAFLAVINTSAGLGGFGSLGGNEVYGGASGDGRVVVGEKLSNGDGVGDGDSGDCNRSSGASGTSGDRAESLLAVHAGEATAGRMSTSSGP